MGAITTVQKPGLTPPSDLHALTAPPQAQLNSAMASPPPAAVIAVDMDEVLVCNHVLERDFKAPARAHVCTSADLIHIVIIVTATTTNTTHPFPLYAQCDFMSALIAFHNRQYGTAHTGPEYFSYQFAEVWKCSAEEVRVAQRRL